MVWSRKYDKCLSCGTTEIPHKAKGLCNKCYGHETNKRLGARQKFTCMQCGKVFSPLFYASTPRKFCSDECSAAWHTGYERGKFHSREELYAAMQQAVLSSGHYLAQAKLLRATHCCYETMRKFDISPVEINYSVGMLPERNSAELTAYYILKKHLPDLRSDHVFYDCLSPKGNVLRYDLYSQDKNLLIEIDGAHHDWDTKQEGLQLVQECDRIKDAYANEHGINMVRVPLGERGVVTEDLLRSVLKNYDVFMDNQQPSPEMGRFNDQSQDVEPSGSKRGAPCEG